jgi:predicted Zn-dependent peptidase
MAAERSIHFAPVGALTLVVEEMPWLPSASFKLQLPVGALSDPTGEEGSAAVLQEWLYRGAGELNSRELAELLDGYGVRRGGDAGVEYLTLSASLLASALGKVLPRYADIVRRPRLEDGEFEGSRALALQELASLDDEPAQRLFVALSERYFASPHGRSPYGSLAGLKALTPESVRRDYARRVSSAGAILSVAGGVSFEELLPRVEELFGDWQPGELTLPEVELRSARYEHIQADTAQEQIGVAYGAVPPGSEHWYAHILAGGVLSGGMGSRLFQEVREKRGLVYAVAATTRALKGFGYTLAYAGTTAERAEETLTALLGELGRLYEGVTEAELERARSGVLSQLVMQGESSSARASALARDVYLLGRPRSLHETRSAIEAVTLEDVNRYLASAKKPAFTVLTLGPKALAADGVPQ